VNLALTMAQSGQKTLLIGANMRRPSIHRFFGIEREPGLSNILVGSAQWRDCIRTVADILMGRFEMEDIMAAPGLDNLHIIEAGPVPANPSELLSTPAMTGFLHSVRDVYDVTSSTRRRSCRSPTRRSSPRRPTGWSSSIRRARSDGSCSSARRSTSRTSAARSGAWS
jgi:hypothetical protein